MCTRYNAVSSLKVTLPHIHAVTLADLHSSAQGQFVKTKTEGQEEA